MSAYHRTVPPRTIVPDTAKSLNPRKDDNLVIHGDNLHALKALLPKYAGRVNCIYIDPPYNTGNEGWAYNDNVSSPILKEWLGNVVGSDDMERHSKWCCMMWPRLQLLRELLAEDGVIFVSIDDNEQHRLRMIMDEIFGENNFRNTISVRRGVKNVQSQFEYANSLNAGWEAILFYSKSPDVRFRHLTKQSDVRRSGSWNNHWRGTDRQNLRYPLMGITPESGQWRWSKERSHAAAENYKKMIWETGDDPSDKAVGEWYFAQAPQKPDLLRMSASGKPEHYVPPTDRKIVSSLWTDLIANEPSGIVKRMTSGFDNPKNTSLVKRIVEYACGEKKDGIVLDSFAGSGTTAHAVLELNKQDGGNRKFILVECEDYADAVTAERVRRVIRGIPDAKNESLRKGTGGSFTYCTLGKAIDAEKMLGNEDFPDYSTLAAYLLYLQNGKTTGDELLPDEQGLFHQAGKTDYYLLYEPNQKFMMSSKARLGTKQALDIVNRKRRAVVFAADSEMGEDDLRNLKIELVRLPYVLEAAR